MYAPGPRVRSGMISHRWNYPPHSFWKENPMFKGSIRVAFALAGILAVTAVPAFAQDLSVGDPAPKLEVKEFVKGSPVKSFEKGKNYVVEFWATWCRPCLA